jgi:hypothetical protein
MSVNHEAEISFQESSINKLEILRTVYQLQRVCSGTARR